MNDMPPSASIDQTLQSSPARPKAARGRVLLLVSGGLLMLSLVGGAAVVDAPTNLMDVAKVLTVVAFVSGMACLAFGMVGDALWP